MDSAEPEQTPFAAVSAQTSRLGRVCYALSRSPLQSPRFSTLSAANPLDQIYQSYLDKCTPYTAYRWVGTAVLLCLFFIRIIVAQGWYIGAHFPLRYRAHALTDRLSPVCYSLGIYLLNLFLAFLQPKFDPSLSQDEGLEDGEASAPTLPTKQDEEFRPFIRRLPEFKFWHSSTRAIAIAFFCTWFEVCNVPVFWPVLVVYFIILFSLTSKSA